MRSRLDRCMRNQHGYTLIEVIVATAIAAVVMTGLWSVITTTARAIDTSVSRVEASSQIRTFQTFAGDDFAGSNVPVDCSAGSPGACLQLSHSSSPVANTFQVKYVWNGSALLDRQILGGSSRHIAGSVTAFSWYLEGTWPNQTCVVKLTITVGSYSESQVLRFYPEIQP